jgi:hypothetical protein
LENSRKAQFRRRFCLGPPKGFARGKTGFFEKIFTIEKTIGWEKIVWKNLPSRTVNLAAVQGRFFLC